MSEPVKTYPIGHHEITQMEYCPECGADKFHRDFGCWCCGGYLINAPAVDWEGVRDAADIIESLLDVQNGRPLEKYREQFDETNGRARSWLARFRQQIEGSPGQ